MELILNRIAKRKGYTIGRLSITPLQLPRGGESEASPRGGLEGVASRGGLEGVYFCDTLEPTWRDYRHGGRKIKGRSAIPEGRYPVVITWSPKMKQWLPLLVNVPMFSGIRIHAGNTAKKGMVLNSRTWLKRLKDKIVEAKERGEAVWITVV